MKRIVLNKKFLLAFVFAAYALMVLFGVVHHEPWRDEAHPWLTAKESTLAQIFEESHYAPTPVLWSLLLLPFARLGFPYETMGYLNASLAIASVAILLFYSRLPFVLKVIIPFSYYLAYEYAVIARQYILTSLFLFSIAALYTKRFRYPILFASCIGLLFQTSFYSALPAGILCIIFSYQLYKEQLFTLRTITALMIMWGMALCTFVSYIPFSALYTAPPSDKVTELSNVFLDSVASKMIFKIPIFPDAVRSTVEYVVIALSAVVLVGIFVLLKQKKTLLIVAGVSFFWLFITNIVLNDGTLRHHGMLFLYIIFFLWLIPGRARNAGFDRHIQITIYSAFAILVLLSISATIYAYRMDYLYNFSGAKDMAQYLQRHNVLDHQITMYTIPDGSAILPYLPGKKFWYPQKNVYSRYFINDNRAKIMPWLTVDSVIFSTYAEFYKDDLYIFSSPVNIEGRGFRLLHTSPVKHFWGNDTEQFWLYTRAP